MNWRGAATLQDKLLTVACRSTRKFQHARILTTTLTTLTAASYGSTANKRSVNRKWSPRTKLLCATAGSCLFLGYSLHSSAFCESLPRLSNDLLTPNTKPSVPDNLPSLTLYQYRTCPFCCKTRAYLDYHEIPYTIVEVNPLFRREIKFSSYRKVPFIVSSDGTQINDSSLLISVLQTFIVNRGRESLSQTLDLYPEMTYTDGKGKEKLERCNKYFIMFGEKGEKEGVSLAERREEREWREWVDQKLVHTLSPNIYRTPSESLQAFNYISRVGNFNVLERVAAKYVGAFSMYCLSRFVLKKRYKLKDNVRESLFECCNEWVGAIGKDRRFMGGESPNLADLAVYGVLSAIEGLDAFSDMIANTDIVPWYGAMQRLVNTQDK